MEAKALFTLLLLSLLSIDGYSVTFNYLNQCVQVWIAASPGIIYHCFGSSRTVGLWWVGQGHVLLLTASRILAMYVRPLWWRRTRRGGRLGALAHVTHSKIPNIVALEVIPDHNVYPMSTPRPSSSCAT
ncbi:hypothetical protein AAG906_036191 [Vitis piasezkii]